VAAATAARAHARSISCEILAGFAELRANMPMNIRASYPGRGLTSAVRADIERITGLWRDCRSASPAPHQGRRLPVRQHQRR